MKSPTWDAASLKAKREKDGLSAEKLANILGASKENIYKWESGTKPHSKGMDRKIQAYINGIKPEQMKVDKTNGAIKNDYKEKYYTLLEKYTALLEQKST